MVGRMREKTVTENLDTQIRDNAAGPKKATGDSGSIAADKYLASKKAIRSRGLGIRLSKLVPAGSA